MNLKKIMENFNKKDFKVKAVTQTEFELEDGTVYPIPFELDYVPTVEEFQKIINNSKKLMLNLMKEVDGTITDN